MTTTLLARTHRATIYAPATEGSDGFPTWGSPTASKVPCNLQSLAGDVRRAAAGTQVDASWKGFAPHDTDIRAGGALVVTAVWAGAAWVAPPANHPTVFRVKQVGYQGPDWDVEFLLDDTDEAIP